MQAGFSHARTIYAVARNSQPPDCRTYSAEVTSFPSNLLHHRRLRPYRRSAIIQQHTRVCQGISQNFFVIFCPTFPWFFGHYIWGFYTEIRHKTNRAAVIPAARPQKNFLTGALQLYQRLSVFRFVGSSLPAPEAAFPPYRRATAYKRHLQAHGNRRYFHPLLAETKNRPLHFP